MSLKPKPWTVVSSELLIEDPWLRLRADDCEMPDGKRISPYYVFDFPDWVTVIPVTQTGDLVLVRQYRHAISDVILELPGGMFDEGENDAVTAAKRELSEETGFTGSDFQQTAKFSPNPASHSNLNHVVVARDLKKTTAQDLDYGEDIEVVLMPVPQVIANLKQGSFKNAIHIASLYVGLAHLGLLS